MADERKKNEPGISPQERTVKMGRLGMTAGKKSPDAGKQKKVGHSLLRGIKIKPARRPTVEYTFPARDLRSSSKRKEDHQALETKYHSEKAQGTPAKEARSLSDFRQRVAGYDPAFKPRTVPVGSTSRLTDQARARRNEQRNALAEQASRAISNIGALGKKKFQTIAGPLNQRLLDSAARKKKMRTERAGIYRQKDPIQARKDILPERIMLAPESTSPRARFMEDTPKKTTDGKKSVSLLPEKKQAPAGAKARFLPEEPKKKIQFLDDKPSEKKKSKFLEEPSPSAKKSSSRPKARFVEDTPPKASEAKPKSTRKKKEEKATGKKEKPASTGTVKKRGRPKKTTAPVDATPAPTDNKKGAIKLPLSRRTEVATPASSPRKTKTAVISDRYRGLKSKKKAVDVKTTPPAEDKKVEDAPPTDIKKASSGSAKKKTSTKGKKKAVPTGDTSEKRSVDSTEVPTPVKRKKKSSVSLPKKVSKVKKQDGISESEAKVILKREKPAARQSRKATKADQRKANQEQPQTGTTDQNPTPAASVEPKKTSEKERKVDAYIDDERRRSNELSLAEKGRMARLGLYQKPEGARDKNRTKGKAVKGRRTRKSPTGGDKK